MCNKNELCNNLNNFSRIAKLKANNKSSSDKNKVFKVNKNKACKPENNNHTIEPSVEALKKILNTLIEHSDANVCTHVLGFYFEA